MTGGLLALLALCGSAAAPAAEPRARDLGVPFDGTPGPLHAITDVAGIEVDFKTLIRGSGPLIVGKGPVRTGVTAIFPRGRRDTRSVLAGYFAGNGNGDMTGTHWIEESGVLETPILITNTNSVGVVRDAETADHPLNDIRGQHVTTQDALDALDDARGGPVAEGNVGGGTGMVCNGFKGGTGTASRKLDAKDGGCTVGVLVQCNYGYSEGLRVAGIPVAREMRLQGECVTEQLKRLARRVAVGLGRLGAIEGDGSGDIFLAFSTANPGADEGNSEQPPYDDPNARVERLQSWKMNPLFSAVIEGTEEAVINSMVAARTMVGADNWRVSALPHDQLQAVLKAHGMLAK